MVGWHHQLNGHEFEEALGVGHGQGGQACYSPWGHKESDTTEATQQQQQYVTEDEMATQDHRLNGHEFEQTQEDSEGQGCLACYSPWGHKESGMTQQLNNSMECSLPDSSVLGISQSRLLEWVAISFSKGYSQPRD